MPTKEQLEAIFAEWERRSAEGEGDYVDDNGTSLRSRATEAGSLPVASRGDPVIPGRCAGSNPAEGNLVGQSGSPPHSFRSQRDNPQGEWDNNPRTPEAGARIFAQIAGELFPDLKRD